MVSILQCLYGLNKKKKGFDIPFEKLESKHVVNLKQCDLILVITTTRWNPIITRVWKIIPFWTFIKYLICYEIPKVVGAKMTMDFCGYIANAPKYSLHFNNAIENIVDKYITHDSDKLTPNLHQTHQHKKNLVRIKINFFFVIIFHGLI
jgi:hypothetical protein